MNDVINSEAFLGLPLGWRIFFGIIIALFLAFSYLLSFKGFRTLMANFWKNIFHIAKQQPLLMHSLFFNKNYYYGMIYRMEFDLPRKTELFVILTRNKVDVTIQTMKDFIKQHTNKFKKFTKSELRDLMFEIRHTITKKSEQAARDKYVEIHGRDKGLKLWGLIYESENGYKKFWDEKNLFLDKYIERLVTSESRNNEDSIRSILTTIDIAIDLAILDCEETFKSLNGQIAELIRH